MASVASPRADVFRALFAAELPWVWTTLRRLGVRTADLEDVSHDLFVRVYKRLEDYDATRAARPWLLAFAYRTASDYRRLARHREEPHEDIPDTADTAMGADDELAQREEAALVQSALASVELDRRAVLVAFEMDGVPMKDIADALNIPVNTAYSRLRIARQEFTDAVRRLQKRREHRAHRIGGES